MKDLIVYVGIALCSGILGAAMTKNFQGEDLSECKAELKEAKDEAFAGSSETVDYLKALVICKRVEMECNISLIESRKENCTCKGGAFNNGICVIQE